MFASSIQAVKMANATGVLKPKLRDMHDQTTGKCSILGKGM